MAASDKKYLVKTVEGEEFGPADQETLTRWAEGGRITPYCQVRSTLLARWENAEKISFLKDVFKELAAKAPKDEKVGIFTKIKRRITLKAARVKGSSGIMEVKAADYESAMPALRIMSGITDALVLTGFAILVYLFLYACYSAGAVESTAAFYVGVVVVYVGTIIYFSWMICFRGQTLGNKCWGIQVRRAIDEDLFLGRTFIFTLGLMSIGWFTPFGMFISPSGRAFHDIVSGTRTVKTKILPSP